MNPSKFTIISFGLLLCLNLLNQSSAQVEDIRHEEEVEKEVEETVEGAREKLEKENLTMVLASGSDPGKRPKNKCVRHLERIMDKMNVRLKDLAIKLHQIEGQTEGIPRQRDVSSCDVFRNKKYPALSSRVIIKCPEGQKYMCDTKTNGGGWIVIQRRIDGRVEFEKPWRAYEAGFGEFHSSFWLGLREIRGLVSKGHWELRIDMEYKGKMKFARYSKFSIGPFKSNYKLKVSGYSGNAGDSLIRKHNNSPFSTLDRDNDKHKKKHCAHITGAWWHSDCHTANLNGFWGVKKPGRGVQWKSLTGFTDTATFTEMKIRRVG